MTLPPRTLSVAPMLDWTDRHYRYFARQISQHTWLYTEMVTTGALIHGNRQRFLDFTPCEMPIALQLGGSDPHALAQCAKWAEEWGYNEVNLNVGCPSERVQTGSFGACLMRDPRLVAECMQAMQDATNIPITIKHRIGIDDDQSYSVLQDFVGAIAQTGCNTFIIHARNAILKGLSPKENREIPPLKYDYVYQLKKDFPQLEVIINGGIKTLAQAQVHLQHVDGVMIGREAYHNPYMVLAQADASLYDDHHPVLSRDAVLQRMIDYAAQQSPSESIHYITKHILGLYQGQAGARTFRRMLSDNTLIKQKGIQIFEDALQTMQEIAANSTPLMDTL